MIKTDKIPEKLYQEGLSEALLKICEENDLTFMGIFGSVVRGEEGESSDIDIAIEFEEGKGKTLFDLVRLEDELSDLLKRKVDLGILSTLSPYIVDDVINEMQVIYEKG